MNTHGRRTISEAMGISDPEGSPDVWIKNPYVQYHAVCMNTDAISEAMGISAYVQTLKLPGRTYLDKAYPWIHIQCKMHKQKPIKN